MAGIWPSEEAEEDKEKALAPSLEDNSPQIHEPLSHSIPSPD